MTLRIAPLVLIAALGLAGCSGKMANLQGPGGGYGAAGAAGPGSVAYFQQSVGDRVLFSVDQSTLNAAARATLDQQARWLIQNTQYRAVIEGHADEQGTREYNLALGARRASAVKDFLVNAGVAPARLETVSYGKERPLEICSEEACYAQNRRAVTVLAVGAGA
ncbi:MAG: peptidoglycan-associated lipoprotein Pal [Qingshengfaniella sp.]